MTRPKNRPKTNGHAGAQDLPNSPAPASTERGGVPAHWDRAASDGASGAPVASAATPAAAGLPRQASTDREAHAEAAPSRTNGAMHKADGTKQKDKGESRILPPGEGPLPDSPGEFVEEIHKRIDLFKVWQRLLKSKDDKIRQRAVERLTDLRYKGAAALDEEPRQIVIDIDSAVARRAAEGARK